MSNGIDLKGVDEIMQQFDYRETPFYFVYQGKDLKFFHAEEDLEAGRALLELHLKQLQNNLTTAPFKIVWFKKLKGDGEIDKQSELGSNTFRVHQPGMSMQKYWAIQNGDVAPEFVAGYGNQKKNGNDEILEYLKGIDSRLTAIENPLPEGEEQEEEDDEPDAGQKVLGALAGIISHPDVQQLLAQKIIGFLNLIPSGNNATVAGANTTPTIQQPNYNNMEDLNELLKVLGNAGMTLQDFQKLANIATTNPGQFSMLLNMLRAQ